MDSAKFKTPVHIHDIMYSDLMDLLPVTSCMNLGGGGGGGGGGQLLKWPHKFTIIAPTDMLFLLNLY